MSLVSLVASLIFVSPVAGWSSKRADISPNVFSLEWHWFNRRSFPTAFHSELQTCPNSSSPSVRCPRKWSPVCKWLITFSPARTRARWSVADSCWEDPIQGLRYDQKISHWLRTFLESDEEIDLVVFDEERFQGRPCHDKPDIPNEAHPNDMAVYHDMCPVHLCSLQSLADLNTRLTREIAIYNFRPNVIVDRVTKAYAEVKDRESKKVTSLLSRIVGEKFKLVKWHSDGFVLVYGSISLRCSPLSFSVPLKVSSAHGWSTNGCQRSQSRTVENASNVTRWCFCFPVDLTDEILFSYRLKPDQYGVKALFGIHITQVDETKSTSKLIHVNDRIEVIKEDQHFWKSAQPWLMSSSLQMSSNKPCTSHAMVSSKALGRGNACLFFFVVHLQKRFFVPLPANLSNWDPNQESLHLFR